MPVYSNLIVCAEELAKKAADMAAYIKSNSHSISFAGTRAGVANDVNAHHPPHPHQHSQPAASASHHRAPATSTSAAVASGGPAAGPKRSRKSVSCMSVSKLTSCRQS